MEGIEGLGYDGGIYFNNKSRLGNADHDLNMKFMKTWWSYFQLPRVP